MRGRPKLSSVLVLATVPLLTGCAGVPLFGGGVSQDRLDEIRAIDGGECYLAAEDGSVDFARAVACTVPHDYEVLDVVQVPEEFASLSVDEAVSEDGELNEELSAYAEPFCTQALTEMSGLQGTVGAIPSLAGAALWPAVSGNVMFNSTPMDVWPEYKALLCVYSPADQTTGAHIRVTSSDAGLVVAAFGGPEATDEARMCITADDSGYLPVPCSRPHGYEALFQFDAALALGEEWVAAVDVSAMTDQQWADLDGLCAAAGPAVFGAERTQTDVTIMAEVFTDTWGVEQAGVATYPAWCLALASNGKAALDGPVWGLGDEPATLVPAT